MVFVLLESWISVWKLKKHGYLRTETLYTVKEKCSRSERQQNTLTRTRIPVPNRRSGDSSSKCFSWAGEYDVWSSRKGGMV